MNSWLRRHPRFHLHYHRDVQLLAEPGRTLVSWSDPATYPPWQLSRGPGIGDGHQDVRRKSQPEAANIRLECSGWTAS